MSETLATRPSKRPRISYGEGRHDDTAPSPADNTQHDDTSDVTEAEPAHIGSNKRRSCGWADLPGELRNHIYELCLAPSGLSIAVRSVKGKGKKHIQKWTEMHPESEWGWLELAKPQRHRPATNLLLINKATYAEGNVYLYSNDFYFFTSKDLSIFLKNLSVAQKLMLQKLVLEIPSPGQLVGMHCGLGMREQSNFLLCGLKELEGAKNLKTLRLALDYPSYFNCLTEPIPVWSPEWLAAEVYKKAQRWLEAIRIQKGSKEKAVELIDFKVIRRDHQWVWWNDHYESSGFTNGSILHKELVKRMR